WLIGLFVTSFTLIPVLIILAFGIPTTKRLEKLKVLKENNGIVGKYYISMVLLSTIFLAMLFITNTVFPNGLIGIIFGGGMVSLFGLGQIGLNEKNVQDYVETNKDKFQENVQTVKYVILGWK
ncbi:MAG: hypothetical protein ACMG6E_04225, partial [Candidatus Roizmanbacteria bacterium]